MKKIFLLFVLAISFAGFAEEISLLRAESSVGSVYGMMWQNTQFLIKAEKGSAEQVVQVVVAYPQLILPGPEIGGLLSDLAAQGGRPDQ